MYIVYSPAAVSSGVSDVCWLVTEGALAIGERLLSARTARALAVNSTTNNAAAISNMPNSAAMFLVKWAILMIV
jgi:hypothetical protein